MLIPTQADIINAHDGWVQLLYYDAPGSGIKTVRFGEITWREYVECEANRINGIRGRQAVVAENDQGELALFVNNVSRDPEDC